MVDIQSAIAYMRRGKRRKKIETTGIKYNGLPITMGGHNKETGVKQKADAAHVWKYGRHLIRGR